MKKKIIATLLAVIMLMNFTVFMPKAQAATFSDVPDTHWAKSYINTMEYINVINGYEDGTFKPDQLVKTGEFIKMACMGLYPNYNYEPPEEGWHWSKPYVEAVDKMLLQANNYNNKYVEQIITRAEATEIAYRLYLLRYPGEVEKEEKYIKQFKDEAEITNTRTNNDTRKSIDNSIKFGLINGFEDGTFRPNEGLTRAQAAKIIHKAIYNY